ncbi:MobF family relaxase [Rothia sp. ZJ932]|uniref:MobF family relaxase n=1 Tax=Rothia sp. ZJ932 TaxID=2810516 RepID=UPI001966F8A5|nr:MobF family relaxase [Rothia sp. ZJ932]QRZ61796.1 relaxase domain-containing protein [Rothia sp. ZJ932]
MMTLHKLSAGDGYTYYTHEVASGDALRAEGREIGDYYTVEGLPPGQFVGSGASMLGLGGAVSEEDMSILFSGNPLPMQTEKLMEIFADRGAKQGRIAVQGWEEKRVEFALKEWEYVHRARCGVTQEEIGKQLQGDRKNPITQQSVSEHLERLRQEGHTLTKYPKDLDITDPKTVEALKKEFINRYRLNDHQWRIAKAYGKKLAQEQNKKDKTNDTAERTYKGADTPYLRAVEAEKARIFRLEDRQPTAKELREIKLQAAATTFRQEHSREPKNEVELRKWMAEQSTPKQKTITGFDMVFTPSKSVSIAWGLGDETLRKGIEAAHEKAIQDVVAYLEENVIYTRRGYNGKAQEEVQGGIIATKFRHYDSRHGDPNLHDHLVIANKVMGQDKRWLTVDGRMLYSYNVTASEVYNSRIAQHIHQDLGLEFVAKEQRGKKIYELAGISEEAIEHFSSRRSDIKKEFQKLKEQFLEEHGYAPNARQRTLLQQQATIATRPAKSEAKSLQELNEQWVKSLENAVELPVGEELLENLRQASAEQADVIAADIAQTIATPLEEHAKVIIDRLEESRSTWRVPNIEAEAQRYFRDVTSGAGVDKEFFDSAVEAVKQQSIAMNNFQTMPLPTHRKRSDGTSVYLRADYQIFSSRNIFEAEQTILNAAAHTKVIPVATEDLFLSQLKKLTAEGAQLSESQQAMAREFLTSEKLLSIGIGPAGAGKTTSSKLTVATAQAAGHQVIGLAPTAAAAAVMRQELGIKADTLDKFLFHMPTVKAGDVLLVDEIGMVSTPKLAKLVKIAELNGAVIRGIGDYRQLSAIGSGGALRLIEREVGAVYLEDVFRFKNQEEAAASLQLREPAVRGADKPFKWYLDNGRVTTGAKDIMVDNVFAAWAKDKDQGKNSVMLAGTNELVTELNERAQARAVDMGWVSGDNFVLAHTGSRIHQGDLVVTRLNNRKITMNRGKDFVKNGDLWTVSQVHEDGSLQLKNAAGHGTVTVPDAYVREYVELGYASTINRAQGATVDTVHAMVDNSTERSAAYVALSRGRESNRLYVLTDKDTTRDEVLENITGNYDRSLSFHEEVARAVSENRDIAHRLDIYQDLTDEAMKDAMAKVAHHAVGKDLAKTVISSDGWGALAHELADAYKEGIDPEQLFKRAYESRAFDNADDYAAVMYWRVQDIRVDDAQKRENTSRSSLAALSDKHLDLLIERSALLTKPLRERVLEDPNWASRPFALTPQNELRERLSRAAAALRANEDNPKLYAEINERVELMQMEIARRRWSSGEQMHVERIVRGEIPRSGSHMSIHQALVLEKQVRESLLPRLDTTSTKSQVTVRGGVSVHTLDSSWERDPYIKDEYRQVLGEHRRQIAELLELRGRQISVTRPVWAQALGQVPASKRNAKHWYRVAAEVEAYRHKYQIADSEPVAVPQKYRESERGKYLADAVANVHKRSRLSSSWKSQESSRFEYAEAEFAYAQKYKLSDAQLLVQYERELKPLNLMDIDFERIRQQQRRKVQAQAQQLMKKYGDTVLMRALTDENVARGCVKEMDAHLKTLGEQILKSAQADVAIMSASFEAMIEAKKAGDKATAKFHEQKYNVLYENYADKYNTHELPSVEKQWLLNHPAYRQSHEMLERSKAAWADSKHQVSVVQKATAASAARRAATTGSTSGPVVPSTRAQELKNKVQQVTGQRPAPQQPAPTMPVTDPARIQRGRQL